MIAIRRNPSETTKSGNPGRSVNQYRYPIDRNSVKGAQAGPEKTGISAWGVTDTWPEGITEPMPVHDEEHTVTEDSMKWYGYLKTPEVIRSEKIPCRRRCKPPRSHTHSEWPRTIVSWSV